MSLTMSTVFHAQFNGRNGDGPVSIPGLKVGDWVVARLLLPSGSPSFGGSPFENVVSVDDELQQTDSITDWSSSTFKTLFFRGT